MATNAKPTKEAPVEPSVETDPPAEVEGLVKADTPSTVKLRATKYKKRNPYTGAVYTTHSDTVVADLQAKECAFERAQIKARVLEIVG